MADPAHTQLPFEDDCRVLLGELTILNDSQQDYPSSQKFSSTLLSLHHGAILPIPPKVPEMSKRPPLPSDCNLWGSERRFRSACLTSFVEPGRPLVLVH